LANCAVIGLGYVGLTSMVGLAHLGHSVIGLDTNENRVRSLLKGEMPIFEPGLLELFKSEKVLKNIELTNSYELIDEKIDFAFLCVSTPSAELGEADLKYFTSALLSLKERLRKGSIVVVKSTVPIGTCGLASQDLKSKGIHVASNPEFLAEGTAMKDFLSPSRIVVGAELPEVAQAVMDLYVDIDAPKLACGLSSAETIKHASNSFLAVKLSFVNELAAICEASGSSMEDVTKGMSLDSRIGEKFLKPGPGWGGSCFPKDTSELAFSARKLGFGMRTVEAAIESNHETINRVVQSVIALCDNEISGVKIAVLGLAFKANTDDTRDSPAIAVADALTKRGAVISAFDPIAKPHGLDQIRTVDSALEACDAAKVLLVLTEWPEFNLLNPGEVRSRMASNPVVFDARRVLDKAKWELEFSRVKVLGE